MKKSSRRYVTAILDTDRQTHGLDYQNKNDNTCTRKSDVLPNSSQRRIVSVNEAVVYPCPRTGCGGWRNATVRVPKSQNSPSSFLCRPAKGSDDVYEIFLPSDFQEDGDSKICEMITDQCPLRLSSVVNQTKTLTATSTKTLPVVTSLSTHNPSYQYIRYQGQDTLQESEDAVKNSEGSCDFHNIASQIVGGACRLSEHASGPVGRNCFVTSNTSDNAACTAQRNPRTLPAHTNAAPRTGNQTNMSNNSAKLPRTETRTPPVRFQGEVVPVLGDGRCLFRSLAVSVVRHLQTTDRLRDGMPKSKQLADAETHGADSLRDVLVQQMRENIACYKDMDTFVLNADQAQQQFDNFEERLTAMSKHDTQAGEIELNAVAAVIHRPVLVLNSRLEYINAYGADAFPDTRACVLRYTHIPPDAGHYDAVILDQDVTGREIYQKRVAAGSCAGSCALVGSDAVFTRTSTQTKTNNEILHVMKSPDKPFRSPKLLAKAEHNYNRDPCEMGIGSNRRCRKRPKSASPPLHQSASKCKNMRSVCRLCRKTTASNKHNMTSLPKCWSCGGSAHQACAKKDSAAWSDSEGTHFLCEDCMDSMEL